MLEGKKIAVVMPAYNAAQTLRRTYEEIPRAVVDDVILVDDASTDATVEIARALGIHTLVHPENRGYGANQKTCYREALARGADVVVMLHPDYQYSPSLVTALAAMVTSELYGLVLGSRMLGEGARAGGMPLYKYWLNQALTHFENALLGQRLSEYHTGYRAYSRELLEKLPLGENSDNFLFDNQIIAQATYFGFRIGELTCTTRYDSDSSSIGFFPSVLYGLGVVATTTQYVAARAGFEPATIFRADGRRLDGSNG